MSNSGVETEVVTDVIVQALQRPSVFTFLVMVMVCGTFLSGAMLYIMYIMVTRKTKNGFTHYDHEALMNVLDELRSDREIFKGTLMNEEWLTNFHCRAPTVCYMTRKETEEAP